MGSSDLFLFFNSTLTTSFYFLKVIQISISVINDLVARTSSAQSGTVGAIYALQTWFFRLSSLS